MARRGLSSDTITLAEARRVALHGQGFRGQLREKKASASQIKKTVDELHLLQIDSVNVLVRSHYLPLFSRLGVYNRETLDKRCFDNQHRHYFECWAHEASLVPLALHPLTRWRMHRARAGDGIYAQMDRFGREEPEFLKSTLAHIASTGPTRASALPGGGKANGSWWGWSKGKLALETLFDQGLVTTATRQGFERVYDLPERVIPAEYLNQPTPPEHEAFRELISLSGKALGIASETDLRDYFRLPPAEARKAIAENLEAGVLRAVKVEGWLKPAYLHHDASLPRKAGGSALLSPFDPLVWNRDRAERLFNFHYRIELYTPEHKRKFGYYVLPFLFEDGLAGRLCLKADRPASCLRVNASHIEAGADSEAVTAALLPELERMTTWLGLDAFKVARKGNLSKILAKHAG
jgi:uncharacterized protein